MIWPPSEWRWFCIFLYYWGSKQTKECLFIYFLLSIYRVQCALKGGSGNFNIIKDKKESTRANAMSQGMLVNNKFHSFWSRRPCPLAEVLFLSLPFLRQTLPCFFVVIVNSKSSLYNRVVQISKKAKYSVFLLLLQIILIKCFLNNISKIWPKLPQKLSNFLKIVIYLYVNTISKKVEQLKNCWHVLNSKNTHVCDIHHFEGWNFLVNFLAKKKTNFTHRNKQVCTWG